MSVSSLMLASLLAAHSTTTLPDGFKARCTEGREAYVELPPSPSANAQLLNGVIPDHNSTIEIVKEGGQFMIRSFGADLIDSVQNGPTWKVDVLKEEPGDLVISATTSTLGASTTLYHLRFQGHIGALSLARTSYYGYGADDTILEGFHCTVTQ